MGCTYCTGTNNGNVDHYVSNLRIGNDPCVMRDAVETLCILETTAARASGKPVVCVSTPAQTADTHLK